MRTLGSAGGQFCGWLFVLASCLKSLCQNQEHPVSRNVLFHAMLVRPSFCLRSFGRLAIVNIVSNLMVPLAGLLDVAFLGHLSEIRHLAGVALATVLFNYLYWTFGFLRMGTTGMTAQASGRHESEQVILIGARHGAIALLIGGLLVLLQEPLQAIGFGLLRATVAVKLSGQAYFRAMIWGAPATLVNFVLIGWFLGRGQSGKVLWLSIVGNGLKVLLDYWLIVRLGWESVGAGTATVVSQYGMLLVGGVLIAREIPIGRLRAAIAKLYDPVALKVVFTLNRDILIRTFALISTFAGFTNLSSGFGTSILAANTVLLEVVMLAAYFIDGVAFATETIAGTLHDRGTDSLQPLVWVSGGVSLGLGLAFAGGLLLLPDPFRALTNHAEVSAAAEGFVGWLLPVLGFGAIAYALDGYFLGLTAGRVLRQSTIVAAVLGFAPAAIAAEYFRNPHLLWLALSLFMAIRAITLARHVLETWPRS